MNKIEIEDFQKDLDSNIDLSNANIQNDLEHVIATGKKKLKTKKQIKAASLALLLVLLSGTLISFGLLSDKDNSDGTSLNVLKNVKLKTQSQDNSTVPVQPTTPQTTLSINTFTPVKFVNYGDANVCNNQTSQPQDGEVQIGPSSIVEKWDPKLNDVKQINSVDPSRVIKIINVQSDANGSTSANLSSGY
ncbi:MAG: hypothetical protein U0R17_02485, partial [Acidimicrobiia bacterium]